MVAGNHDFAAVNKLSISNFNPAAQASTHWTSAQLSRDGFDFLAALPLTAITGDFTLVHGSLKDPLTEYLLNAGAALDTFALMTTPHGLVGHSHIPFICEATNDNAAFLEFFCDVPAPLGDTRCIINPGGVGQPRTWIPGRATRFMTARPTPSSGSGWSTRLQQPSPRCAEPGCLCL